MIVAGGSEKSPGIHPQAGRTSTSASTSTTLFLVRDSGRSRDCGYWDIIGIFHYSVVLFSWLLALLLCSVLAIQRQLHLSPAPFPASPARPQLSVFSTRPTRSCSASRALLSAQFLLVNRLFKLLAGTGSALLDLLALPPRLRGPPPWANSPFSRTYPLLDFPLPFYVARSLHLQRTQPRKSRTHKSRICCMTPVRGLTRFLSRTDSGPGHLI